MEGLGEPGGEKDWTSSPNLLKYAASEAEIWLLAILRGVNEKSCEGISG